MRSIYWFVLLFPKIKILKAEKKTFRSISSILPQISILQSSHSLYSIAYYTGLVKTEKHESIAELVITMLLIKVGLIVNIKQK